LQGTGARLADIACHAKRVQLDELVGKFAGKIVHAVEQVVLRKCHTQAAGGGTVVLQGRALQRVWECQREHHVTARSTKGQGSQQAIDCSR